MLSIFITDASQLTHPSSLETILKKFLIDFERLTKGTVTLVTGLKSVLQFDLNHKAKDMAANIITLEDLQNFKKELIEELKNLLTQRQTTPIRKWLKSHEVRRLLTISPGTLQNLRVNGNLPFTKIGGVIYYDYEDIQRMLQEHKAGPHFVVKKAA